MPPDFGADAFDGCPKLGGGGSNGGGAKVGGGGSFPIGGGGGKRPGGGGSSPGGGGNVGGGGNFPERVGGGGGNNPGGGGNMADCELEEPCLSILVESLIVLSFLFRLLAYGSAAIFFFLILSNSAYCVIKSISALRS